MRTVFIAGAKRTPVAPRNGALAEIPAPTLAAEAIKALLADLACDPRRVDALILGNALYGGGNPARVAGLAAELGDAIRAMTIDTQCCGGLDAIAIAASLVGSGQCDLVLAGGLESYSRAPIRLTRPASSGEEPKEYRRPPFTPWPDRDPDMIQAAARVAAELSIHRDDQARYAVESHAKHLSAVGATDEIIPLGGLTEDSFARRLTMKTCNRLPVLVGAPEHGQTAATIAVEADAAAIVAIASEQALRHLRLRGRPLRYCASAAGGDDPARPVFAPVPVTNRMLEDYGVQPDAIVAAEIMEAFAVQAMVCIQGIGLDPCLVNRSGGALARGHPIGASGAILAVRLWHELQREAAGTYGLAAIAAAGGLASALLVSPS